MPVKILSQVRPHGFVPVNDEGWAAHKSFKIDATVRLDIVRSKSRQAERFYWALVQKVGDGIGVGKRPLSNELLIRTGFVDRLVTRNNEIHHIPRSIADMKHVEFCEYLEAAIKLICEDYIAMTRGQLLREVEKMLGISYAEATKEKEQE